MNISLFLLLTVVLGVVVVNVNVVTATNQVGSIMLKGNKYNPAITTLESGLQYKIVRSGGSTNAEHPTLYSPCKINYIGKTLNSKIFDSSSSNFVYNEDMYHMEEEKEIAASSKSSSGRIIAPYQVILCLQEAMQLMVVGDKWALYCPSELAYGDIGSNEKNIYPGDMLMYDLELLEIFAAPVLGEDGSNTNEILEILPPVPVEEPPPSTDTDTVVEDEIEIEDNSAPDAPDSSFDSEL